MSNQEIVAWTMSEAQDKKQIDELLARMSRIGKLYGEKSIHPKRPADIDDGHIANRLYVDNTYITVYEEAQKRKCTMHEICIAKGLDYNSLIY